MKATKAPSMYMAPCMKFTTRIMPNTMLRPRLISAMKPPLTSPLKIWTV